MGNSHVPKLNETQDLDDFRVIQGYCVDPSLGRIHLPRSSGRPGNKRGGDAAFPRGLLSSCIEHLSIMRHAYCGGKAKEAYGVASSRCMSDTYRSKPTKIPKNAMSSIVLQKALFGHASASFSFIIDAMNDMTTTNTIIASQAPSAPVAASANATSSLSCR